MKIGPLYCLARCCHSLSGRGLVIVSKQTGTFSAFYLPPLDGRVYRVLKSACAPFTLACPRPQPFCTISHTPFFGLVLSCLGCDNVGKLEETSCLDPLGTPPPVGYYGARVCCCLDDAFHSPHVFSVMIHCAWTCYFYCPTW